MGVIICSLLGSLAGIVVFIYFLRKGQFDNCEEIKYQMFRDDETPK